jgi:hypothetical protein
MRPDSPCLRLQNDVAHRALEVILWKPPPPREPLPDPANQLTPSLDARGRRRTYRSECAIAHGCGLPAAQASREPKNESSNTIRDPNRSHHPLRTSLSDGLPPNPEYASQQR